MKVLFIVPNIESRVGSPAVNAAVLISFINNRTEHKAKIADLTFHKKDWQKYLKTEIEREQFDLIGISVLSFDYSQSLRIASYIKENFDTVIIMGGIHPTLMPEEVIKHESVDIVCIGEGEYALKEILDNKLDCRGVKGIWFKENGKIIKNELGQLLENLDELPFPDWREFDLERYFIVNNNHLTLMASRGCPYSCSYCNNHVLKKILKGKYVRFRSVDNVIEEVGEVICKYYGRGFKYIYFIDDIFILHKEWVKEFCRKYKEQGYHKTVKWMVNVRANLVTEEIIYTLKDAGCYQVGMGIEAANDYIRNGVYKREMSKEQINEAVKIIKDSGLLLSLQFIVGAPYETLEMMEESLTMAREINADTVMFSILMPLPRTDIEKVCREEGLIEESAIKHAQVMYAIPVVRSKYATRKQIKAFYKKARNYQVVKYLREGLKNKGLVFLWDLLVFFLYYKPKYQLEIQNAFKFTVKKYILERLKN